MANTAPLIHIFIPTPSVRIVVASPQVKIDKHESRNFKCGGKNNWRLKAKEGGSVVPVDGKNPGQWSEMGTATPDFLPLWSYSVIRIRKLLAQMP
jgi:hypothetical protein